MSTLRVRAAGAPHEYGSAMVAGYIVRAQYFPVGESLGELTVIEPPRAPLWPRSVRARRPCERVDEHQAARLDGLRDPGECRSIEKIYLHDDVEGLLGEWP